MKLVLSILSVLFVVNAQVSVHNPVYCYSSDPLRPQNGMHASQSSYQAIHRPNVNPNVSTCTPTRLWFVSRHGGRYPDPVTMQSMIELANGPLQNNVIDNYRADLLPFVLEILILFKIGHKIHARFYQMLI
ncbi:CLUMA_CG004135, isoform A [Clunio marinus]|uniref:CLUMA_CG004135, isoform A n=1 Tax=Clunio marinus TaxID=568069 RepID=A0A1J1HRC5_9DIPT|nr:CLUMA_CG004135, isoform A [Clunio marinus]